MSIFWLRWAIDTISLRDAPRELTVVKVPQLTVAVVSPEGCGPHTEDVTVVVIAGRVDVM